MNKKKPAKSQQQQQHQPIRSTSKPGKAPNTATAVEEEFLYDNKRIMHSCTALIGSPVSIETIDGHIYEGIFKVFSPKLDLTLDVAHQVDPNDPTKILEENVTTMVFPLSEIIRCSATDTDLDYATKVGFMTDTQISSSKTNGEVQLKQLEHWIPDSNDDTDFHDLHLVEGNGWAPEDMFAVNEREHGVQTTFKPNLEGYTIQLSKDKNSQEYREREAYAAEVAREIEGNATSRAAVELENGDEEEAFSAVVRPQRDNDTDRDGKYVPPALRQNSQTSMNSNKSGRSNNTAPRHGGPQRGPSPPMQQQQQPRRQDRDYHSPPSAMSTPSSHSGRDHHGSAHHDDHGRGGGGVNTNMANARRSFGRDYDGQQQQRPSSGRGTARTRNDQISELKEFGNKFNLASPSSPSNASPEQTSPAGQAPPRMSPTLAQERKRESPPIGSAEPQQSVSPHLLQQQSPTVSIGAYETQTSEHELSSGGQNIDTVSSPTLLSSATPPSMASTQTTSTAATVKKSTLNPNAKEFVLNPNAKVFVPGAATGVGIIPGRPPISGTPPQRPMTPATPNMPLGFGASQVVHHPLLGPGGPGGPLPHPHPNYIHYVPTTGPMFNPATNGPQPSPFHAYPNTSMAVTQSSMHAQQQQQQMNQQRFRGNPNSNQGPPRPMNPSDVQSPNHILAATGQPILAQINAGSPQAPGYMPVPPHIAMMHGNPMLMRIPPGPMMMVSQPAGQQQMPITSVASMMDPSGGGHPNMTWMPQQQGGQVPPPHMPGPPPNTMAGHPHLAQPPPPQASGGPQHNGMSNQAQVAAVQAAVAQQQQQMANNGGGGNTPAPSPGPHPMFNTSGPQSLPQQFSMSYPNGVFIPPGSGHPSMMPAMISPQGQGVPPPHAVHQFAMQHQAIPGQQNAPHTMMLPHGMPAPHQAVPGQPQPGGPGPQ